MGEVFDAIWDNFEKHAENFADELIPFAFRLLIGLIAFWVIWRLGHIISDRTERGLLRASADRGAARLVAKAVLYAVGIVAFSVLLAFLGVREAAIAAVLGIGTLAVTLSMQDLLRNVVAGVYIPSSGRSASDRASGWPTRRG
ncbi:MAG: mechanosensitive ion channel [Dehalococcoidia bacterium]|nr:mechanosensitive ion channel [Dehalococcoidia bacterium]